MPEATRFTKMPSTSGSRVSAPTAFRSTGPDTTSICATTRPASIGRSPGSLWARISPQARYECRHGLSYSKFSCDYQDLARRATVFIPLDDDVSCGTSGSGTPAPRARTLSVFAYVEFSFHHIEIDNQNLQMSLYASGSSYQDGVIEYDFLLRTFDLSLLHRPASIPTVSTLCATVSSAAIARRRTRSRSNRAAATAVWNWAATTAALCTSG